MELQMEQRVAAPVERRENARRRVRMCQACGPAKSSASSLRGTPTAAWINFLLRYHYKTDPQSKFFRNQSVFFCQRIDLSLGDDGSKKLSEIFRAFAPCLQTKLCIQPSNVAIYNKRQLGKSIFKMLFENIFASNHILVKVRIIGQRCSRR